MNLTYSLVPRIIPDIAVSVQVMTSILGPKLVIVLSSIVDMVVQDPNMSIKSSYRLFHQERPKHR